jgi:predicted transcriptional regulator/very-short-patch-repair endonuclease
MAKRKYYTGRIMSDKLKCCICGFEKEKSILSHVRTIHNLSAKEYRDKFNSPLRIFAGSIDQVRSLGRNNSKIMLGKPSHATLPNNKWSRLYDKCIQCSTTERPHVAAGLCKKCRGKNNMRKTTKNNNASIALNGKEGKDYVICQICGQPFQSLTSYGHLKIHNIDDKEYRNKFPDSLLYGSNININRGKSISMGRKKLMLDRGYLNPASQRLSKSKEMARKHATDDFSKVSKIEDIVSDYLALVGYTMVWNDYAGEINDNIIIRQYLFEECYCTDFAYPCQKIIVEVLGDWWHGWEVVCGRAKKEDQHKNVQKNIRIDINRFNFMKNKGWNAIKIWEHDIKNSENYKNILAQYFPKIVLEKS